MTRIEVGRVEGDVARARGETTEGGNMRVVVGGTGIEAEVWIDGSVEGVQVEEVAMKMMKRERGGRLIESSDERLM